MEKYLHSPRDYFERSSAREGIYGEMIRSKLRGRDMPEDLLYIAMVESGFRTKAISRSSASGLWQFMRPTAEAQGLMINSYVDERHDPVRSTDAALDYLEMLYARFDSWYLAAAAYNAGPNRVARVLRDHAPDRVGEQDPYWRIREHLPRETRDYVPRLLASILLSRDPDRYGLRRKFHEPYRFDQVRVPGGTFLERVAQSLDLPLSRIRDLNPHILKDMTPPGIPYEVRIPVGESRRVVAALGLSGCCGATEE